MGNPTAALCKASELKKASGPAGILSELVGGPRSANVSVACRRIRKAQAAGEFVAWVATHRDVFFPPDMAAAGIDLAALPVVWTGIAGPTGFPGSAGEPGLTGTANLGGSSGRASEPRPTGSHGLTTHAGRAVRAAEQLLRSGAFGLIVIDLAKDLTLHSAGQGRLLRLAERHGAEVLILRRRREDGAYSGSLVAVRSESMREPVRSGVFRCTITNTKDKREGPGWTTSEEFCGPPGLY